jgi:hypothetical protein
LLSDELIIERGEVVLMADFTKIKREMASLKKKITENTRRRSNMKVLMQETAD